MIFIIKPKRIYIFHFFYKVNSKKSGEKNLDILNINQESYCNILKAIEKKSTTFGWLQATDEGYSGSIYSYRCNLDEDNII